MGSNKLKSGKKMVKECCKNCVHNQGERHKSKCLLGKAQNKTNKPYYLVKYKRCCDLGDAK
jgi:hypothetical protein